MRHQPRAFTIIEILVAVLVAAASFFVFLTVFRSSYENAAHTRNRAIATTLAKTLLEEIEAHPYGAPMPQRWTTLEDAPTTAAIWIQGQPVETRLHKKFSFKNSSFIGVGAAQDTDVVTLQISWREGAGTAQAVTTGATEDNRQIDVKVPVWR